MLDWVTAMLGIASRTKTSNLESFAHWPTQRFERIAQAGPLVTNGEGNRAPFHWFWPAFQARIRQFFGKPLGLSAWRAACRFTSVIEGC